MNKKLNFVVDTQSTDDAGLETVLLDSFGEGYKDSVNIIFGDELKKATYSEGASLDSVGNYENVIIFNQNSAYIINNGVSKPLVVDGSQSEVDGTEYKMVYTFSDDDGNEITDYSAIITTLPIESYEAYFKDGGGMEEIETFTMNGVTLYDENSDIQAISFDKQNMFICIFDDSVLKINKFITTNSDDANEFSFMADEINYDSNKARLVIYQEEYEKLMIIDNDPSKDNPTYFYGSNPSELTETTSKYDAGFTKHGISAISENETFFSVTIGSEVMTENKFFQINYIENDTTLPEDFINAFGSSYYEISSTYDIHDGDTLVSKNGIVESTKAFKVESIAGGISEEIVNLISKEIETTNVTLEEVQNSIPTANTIASEIVNTPELMQSIAGAIAISLVASNGDEITSNMIFDTENNKYVLDYDTSLLDGTDYTIELKLGQ